MTTKRHRVGKGKRKGITWDVHIYDPRTQTTTTKQLFVEGTTGMADVRSVYVAAERAFGGNMDRMMAVPHRD